MKFLNWKWVWPLKCWKFSALSLSMKERRDASMLWFVEQLVLYRTSQSAYIRPILLLRHSRMDFPSLENFCSRTAFRESSTASSCPTYPSHFRPFPSSILHLVGFSELLTYPLAHYVGRSISLFSSQLLRSWNHRKSTWKNRDYPTGSLYDSHVVSSPFFCHNPRHRILYMTTAMSHQWAQVNVLISYGN